VEVFALTLEFFLEYGEYAGCKTDHITGTYKILDLVIALAERYGPKFRKHMLKSDMSGLDDDVTVIINGININTLEGHDTVAKDEDTVTFIPSVMGG
jgi:molybdopterin converting factor small subunit